MARTKNKNRRRQGTDHEERHPGPSEGGDRSLPQPARATKKTPAEEKSTHRSPAQNSKVSKPKNKNKKKKGKTPKTADQGLLDKLTQAFGDASMLERGEQRLQEQNTRSSRKTRSKTGMLPLGFDKQYLDNLGTETAFMNNDQIRTWIKSVSSLHLESWCKDCLRDPQNHEHLEEIVKDSDCFAQSVIDEAMSSHESQRRLGKPDNCPTALHSEIKHGGMLTILQHTAMTACLVVRDGQRGGKFAECKSQRQLHRAAVMLLVSIIMDLSDNKSSYFSEMLLGEDKADEAMDDGGVVLTGIEFGPVADSGSPIHSQDESSQVTFNYPGMPRTMAAEIEEFLQQREASGSHTGDIDMTVDTAATASGEATEAMDEAGD